MQPCILASCTELLLCWKSAVTARQAFPLWFSLHMSSLILWELQMTPRIHTRGRCLECVCVWMCMPVYIQPAAMCSHRKIILEIIFPKYLIVCVQCIYRITCPSNPPSPSSASFHRLSLTRGMTAWVGFSCNQVYVVVYEFMPIKVERHNIVVGQKTCIHFKFRHKNILKYEVMCMS